MNRKNKAKPKKHSHRVAAWVYTVINPVVASLEREIQFLEESNLTWRHYSRRCEYLRPVQEYVEPVHWPNYEDFLADNHQYAKEFLVHRNCLKHVESLATIAFETLMHAGIFRKQVFDSLDRYEASMEGSRPGSPLAYMKDDLPNYIAEYLINNVESLPSHYSAQKFWQMFSHEFQSFKQRQSFTSLSAAIQDLLSTSTKLRRSLEDHRLSLCRKFDVPAAPVSLQVNVGSAFHL